MEESAQQNFIEDTSNMEDTCTYEDTSMSDLSTVAIDESFGVKRPAEQDNEPDNVPPCKIAKTPGSFKNVFRQLSLLKPGLMFDLEKEETSEDGMNKVYTMVVDVDGVKFRGEGPSKRNAKVMAAELVLTHLDELGVKPIPESERPQRKEGENAESAPVVSTLTEEQKAQQAMGKNPVMMLHEIRPNFSCELTEDDCKGPTRKVEMTITVDGQKFTGSGRSNKLARARAAVNALESLFNLEFTDFGENEIPVYLGEEINWRRFTKKAEKSQPLTPQGKAAKNAMMQINDMYKGLEFKVVERSGPDHCPFFKVNVDIEGQTFEGQGSTKKSAKLNAAERALVGLSLTGALAQRAAQKKQQKFGNQKNWSNSSQPQRTQGKNVPQLSQSFHPASKSQNGSGSNQWPPKPVRGRGGGQNWRNTNTPWMDKPNMNQMNQTRPFMRGGPRGMPRGGGRGQNPNSRMLGGMGRGGSDPSFGLPPHPPPMNFMKQKMDNQTGPSSLLPNRGRGITKNTMRGNTHASTSPFMGMGTGRGQGGAKGLSRGRGRGNNSQQNTAASGWNQDQSWNVDYSMYQDLSSYEGTSQWDSSNYGYDTNYDASYDNTDYNASVTGYTDPSGQSYEGTYENEYDTTYDTSFTSGYQNDGSDWNQEYYNY